jgi:hypothetical protein
MWSQSHESLLKKIFLINLIYYILIFLDEAGGNINGREKAL